MSEKPFDLKLGLSQVAAVSRVIRCPLPSLLGFRSREGGMEGSQSRGGANAEGKLLPQK